MKIIGRTNRNIIDRLPVECSVHLVNVPIESLKFRKEIGFWKIAINNSDRVIRVIQRNEIVLCLLDRLHMPWGNISTGSNQCKIFHFSIIKILINKI